MISVAQIKQVSGFLNNENEPKLVRLNSKHLPTVFKIQSEGLSSPWTFENVQGTLSSAHSFSFGLLLGDELVAVCLATLVLDEVNILNFVTHQEYRRQGYASYLLQEIISLAKQRKIESFFLEVRESNIPAIHLYESFGFVELTERKNYYTNPVENAIVMALNIKKQ